MTPADFETLLEYLGDNPPLHLMVASFLGIECTGAVSEAKDCSEAEAAAFFQHINGQH